MRVWRNWQTRKIQVLMFARMCRFKSCHPHQKKDAELETILRLFSTKSTFSGGINRIYDEIPHAWDEIRLDGGCGLAPDLLRKQVCPCC